MHNVWMASDFDGAFAEYVKVPASEVARRVRLDRRRTRCDPVRLRHRREHDPASGHQVRRPCKYHRRIRRTAQRRCNSPLVEAPVVAMASRSKFEEVRALGAHELVERGEALEPESCDVVIDNVAGPGSRRRWKRSGAVDVSSPPARSPARSSISMSAPLPARHRLIDSTADEPVFPNLVGYIERGEIRPRVAKTFPLTDIVAAQQEFLRKAHVGKFVLIPDRAVSFVQPFESARQVRYCVDMPPDNEAVDPAESERIGAFYTNSTLKISSS